MFLAECESCVVRCRAQQHRWCGAGNGHRKLAWRDALQPGEAQDSCEYRSKKNSVCSTPCAHSCLQAYVHPAPAL